MISMANRNGKIANLPSDLREQLNLRLLEGETARELAAWLNALPEAQSLLASQFNASPISEVNLTHWRQGGYLQWLTERECFDSARALAEGDADFAKTGLSAERLLNILTLRMGQLLMRWDFSPEEGVSAAAAFAEVARKARILQGISRTVLAIHRIQSPPDREKSNRVRPVANSRPSSDQHAQPGVSGEASKERGEEASPAPTGCPAPAGKVTNQPAEAKQRGMKTAAPIAHPPSDGPSKGMDLPPGKASKIRDPKSPMAPSSIPLDLAQTPFMANLDRSEALQAV